MTSDTPEIEADGSVVVPLDEAVDASSGQLRVAQDSRARAIRRRRNSFRPHEVPSDPMGKALRGWSFESRVESLFAAALEPVAGRAVPSAAVPIVDWFYCEPDARDRFRWALRDSLDELLDGQRTGRWAYQHLSKTEKTYLGTAVEVNLTKEFDLANGDDLDWRIAGIDIDCKFSKDLGGWEIPMEMYLCEDHGDRQGKADHPALLTWLNDDLSQWAAGIITVTDDRLRWKTDKDLREKVRAYNRDNKRRLDPAAAVDVYWLWGGLQTDLPRNLVLHLAPEARERIFAYTKSGQKRVDQLFREVRGRIVGRQTVLTVAQQDDAPKRARDARLNLREDGILVLGHQDAHPSVAAALGLPVPVKGEWISVRVTPVPADSDRPSFVLDGTRWATADPEEPVVAAPSLPTSYRA